MKKSIYFLMMFAGLAFTSCEPMEDLHDEIDAQIDATPNAGVVDYTLTEENYTDDEEDGGFGLDDANFTSVDQANELIPGLLSELYPVLGKGSIANVNVVVAEPYAYEVNTIEYEVTDEDYAAINNRFKNFDDVRDVIEFVEGKFPDAVPGTVIELTYNWYAGSVSVVTSDFLKLDETTWIDVISLERPEYQAMSEAFANFDNTTEAMQKLPVYLNSLFPYAPVNDTQAVLFEVHVGGGNTVHYLKTFTFDGSEWQGSFEMSLQFGHDGTVWEPDNTIVYTLTTADYDLVLGDDNYGNFNYWDDEDKEFAFESIITILETRFPDVEEGQKILVNYLGYSGSVVDYSATFIYTDGAFVKM